MINIQLILSMLLIVTILLILIVKKYERFNNGFLLQSNINNLGTDIIEPNKCKFINDIVLPNILMRNKLIRSNNNISNQIKSLLLNKTSVNSLSNYF